MTRSFRDHPLTDAERAWLEAAYRDEEFDPKIAKVNLRDKLPRRFDHRTIDNRLLLSGKKLTLLGISLIDPEASIVRTVEAVILKIRDLILERPGVETITAETLSVLLPMKQTEVAKALEHLSIFGGFYSQASGHSDSVGYSSIILLGDDAYDAYLAFESIESLMQQYYEQRAESSRLYAISTLDTPLNIISGTPWQSANYVYTPQTPVLHRDTKKGAAFVLMPMNPDDAQLEDVYEAIKQACTSFGIRAYRADDIQHQDRITDMILAEIMSCELLIADLSHERPNVYYEIGYAHAIQKRPILYRKHGTRLHFDLAVHNVPEYRNATELRSLLAKRLEAILGRGPSSAPT